jgi:hypothetical protein
MSPYTRGFGPLPSVMGCWSSRRGLLDRWQAFRFFLMPFCVSSFSALVKGRGFLLVFSPVKSEVMAGLVACAAFLGVVWAAHRSRPDDE